MYRHKALDLSLFSKPSPNIQREEGIQTGGSLPQGVVVGEPALKMLWRPKLLNIFFLGRRRNEISYGMVEEGKDVGTERGGGDQERNIWSFH